MNLYEYIRENHREELLLEWDRASNASLNPAKLSPSSRVKPVWVCEKGHRYRASLVSRIQRNSGCPYCSGLKVMPGETDLLTLRPDIARLWDTEKNDCGPDRIMPNSHKQVYWRCEKGHSWEAKVYAVTNGSGCPYCSGLRPIPGVTDLATTHPQLAAEWDEEKNGAPASTVSAGSTVNAWWRCPEGHSYQSVVYSRNAGTGCPYCAGKKVLRGYNDLATTDPELAAEWVDERMNPTEINRGSHKVVRWKCALGHEYESPVFARVAGNGCPYCTGRKVLAGFNDLATTHPKVAAQWNYDLNNELMPEMVTKGSNRKVWWKCSEGHTWQAAIFSRTRKKASDCPVCAGKTKIRFPGRYQRVDALTRVQPHKQKDTRMPKSTAV